MEKINLKTVQKEHTSTNTYRLNPNEKYVINMIDEIDWQRKIMMSFQIMGAPPALKNYYAWVMENGFNADAPNPTNKFVEQYYGVKPLWVTEYSQGIVVLDEVTKDYYIVMECSNKNKGYKYTIIVLTLGGCL